MPSANPMITGKSPVPLLHPIYAYLQGLGISLTLRSGNPLPYLPANSLNYRGVLLTPYLNCHEILPWPCSRIAFD